jgi:hypothetical protein
MGWLFSRFHNRAVLSQDALDASDVAGMPRQNRDLLPSGCIPGSNRPIS